MKRKEKELLIRDLCARLPYHTKVLYRGGITDLTTYARSVSLEGCKPYLRRMSSMTDEEKKRFDDFCVIDEELWGKRPDGFANQAVIMSNGIDYLLSRHIDFRGLIDMGLAIEVTEDNNPYKEN